jgi:hypothetical protein
MTNVINNIEMPTLTEMISSLFEGNEVNNQLFISYKSLKYKVSLQKSHEGSLAYIALDKPLEYKTIIQEDNWTTPTQNQLVFAKELLSNGLFKNKLEYGYGSQPNYSQDLLDQKHA